MVDLNKVGLIPKTQRGRVLRLVLLFLALATVSGIHRLHTERHYSRMFVRLDESLAGDDSVTVFTLRLDGVMTPLIRRNEDRRLFSRDSGWQKVRSIVITGDAVGTVRPEQLEVRVGSGWPHTTALSVGEVRALSLENASLDADRRRLRFNEAYEVTVDGGRASVFLWNAGVINWQGDLLLLIHSLCLGLFYFVLLSGLCWILSRLGGLPMPTLPKTGGPVRLAAEIVRFFMLVLTAHLAWLWFWQLTVMREAVPLVQGILGALGIAALIAGWFKIVDRARSERQLAIRMLLLTGIMALLKLFWLSHVEGIPRSDYAEYYKYGKQMAAGDWDAIRNESKVQSAIYLRRASVCTLPVVLCFGSSISTFEIVNTAVQSLTAVMFCLLVRRISGMRAAAYALPLLLISPEIWYQVGMITHNVFGYFWIVATWLAFDGYLIHAGRLQNHGAGWLLRIGGAVFWGIVVGVGVTMVDISKGYGIFFEAGLLAVTVFGPAVMRALAGTVCDGLSFYAGRYSFLIIALLTSQILLASANSLLLSRSGIKLPPLWLPAHASAVEAAGPGGGESLAVWMSRYHYRTPQSHVIPVVFRKILHERIGQATESLKCVFRKNLLLCSVVDAMGHSQDSVTPSNAAPAIENVRFGSMQFALCNALMLALGIGFVARLLLPEPLVSSWSELFPLLTSGLVLAVVYLTFEAHAYYSVNFIFPFCWSAGVALDRLRRAVAPATVSPGVALRRLFSVDRFAGAATGIALLCCYCLLGTVVDQMGLTFFRVAAGSGGSESGVAEAAVVEALPENAASGVSRVHGWLEFRSECGVVRKGERIVQRFRVQTGRSRLPGLSFFISGNQRARIHRINDNWKSLPFRYSVSIEDFVLAENRPIEELALPRFRSVPRHLWDSAGKDAGGDVTVTVTLECTEDVAIGRLSPPPAVAIEYFH
jgi:hypothetical protein